MSDSEKIPVPIEWRTLLDKRLFEALRETDKRTKDLCKTVRESFRQKYPDLAALLDNTKIPVAAIEDAIDPLRPGKNKLVPVDRVIAALHLLTAEYTFHTIPKAIGTLLEGQVAVYLESKVAAMALIQIAGKGSFLGTLVNLFKGVFGIPAQRKLKQSIEDELASEGRKVAEVFQQSGKSFFGLSNQKPALLRHPPSSGEPIIGLDGKIRGRKRTVRDVQTRHWKRPKSRRKKGCKSK